MAERQVSDQQHEVDQQMQPPPPKEDMLSCVVALEASLLPCLPARELQALDRSPQPSHQNMLKRKASESSPARRPPPPRLKPHLDQVRGTAPHTPAPARVTSTGTSTPSSSSSSDGPSLRYEYCFDLAFFRRSPLTSSLMQWLDDHGWSLLLTPMEPAYPRVVRQFYESMYADNEESVVVTIDGNYFSLSAERIRTALQLPASEPSLASIFSDQDLHTIAAEVSRGQIHDSYIRAVALRSLELRTLFLFLSYDLFPYGHKDQLTGMQAHVLYLFSRGSTLSISHMIFIVMRAVGTSRGHHLPYPRLITRLLQEMGYRFAEDEVVGTPVAKYGSRQYVNLYSAYRAECRSRGFYEDIPPSLRSAEDVKQIELIDAHYRAPPLESHPAPTSSEVGVATSTVATSSSQPSPACISQVPKSQFASLHHPFTLDQVGEMLGHVIASQAELRTAQATLQTTVDRLASLVTQALQRDHLPRDNLFGSPAQSPLTVGRETVVDPVEHPAALKTTLMDTRNIDVVARDAHSTSSPDPIATTEAATTSNNPTSARPILELS